jgi:hypothetical protein
MKKLFSLLTVMFTVCLAAIGCPDYALATGSAIGINGLAPALMDRGHLILNELVTFANNPSQANPYIQSILFDLQGTEVLENIKKGKMRAYASPYYFRKQYNTTTSPENFILSSDKKQNGYTNLEDGRLPKGELLILTKLAFAWHQLASGGSETANQLLYSNLIWNKTSAYAAGSVDLATGVKDAIAVRQISQAIVNAAFTVREENRIIVQGNYSDYFVDNRDGVNVPANAYADVTIPKALVGDRTLKLETSASGATFESSTNFYLEVKLGGVVFKPTGS